MRRVSLLAAFTPAELPSTPPISILSDMQKYHAALYQTLSARRRIQLLAYLYYLSALERLNDFIDWYVALPFALRRRVFHLADRFFYPAHWVEGKHVHSR